MADGQIEQLEVKLEEPKISVEDERVIVEYPNNVQSVQKFGPQVAHWREDGKDLDLGKWADCFIQVRKRVWAGLATVVRGGKRTGKSEILCALGQDPKVDLKVVDWQFYNYALDPEMPESEYKYTEIAEKVFGKADVNSLEGVKEAIEEANQKAEKEDRIFAVAFDEAQGFEMRSENDFADYHRALVQFLREKGIPFVDCLVEVPGKAPCYQDLYNQEEVVNTSNNVTEKDSFIPPDKQKDV